MRFMKNFYRGLGVLLLSLFLYGPAQAIDTSISWSSKTCFSIGPMQGCKPSEDWDTQRNRDFSPHYKFVYHKSRANPEARIRFVENPAGKTVQDFASDVEGSLRHLGMIEIKSHKEHINGREAVIIDAYNPAKNRRFLYGVFRTENLGVYWECMAAPDDFHQFRQAFMSAISSTRLSGN